MPAFTLVDFNLQQGSEVEDSAVLETNNNNNKRQRRNKVRMLKSTAYFHLPSNVFERAKVHWDQKHHSVDHFLVETRVFSHNRSHHWL